MLYSIRLQGAVRRLQQLVDTFLTGGRFPGFPQLAVCGTGSPHIPQANGAAEPSGSWFLESLKEGFVWGVPKKRKSLEKRVRKQWGTSYMAPFQLRTDLIVCLHCGHYHEAHSLCGHCYEKVQKETKLIYDTMNIKARGPEQAQEVVVLYEDETVDPAVTHGKRVVEVPKKRPLWFSSNLLAKVATPPQKKEE